MSAIIQWLAMGGYADFVWPSYAIAVVVLGGVGVCSWRRHRHSARLLAQLQLKSGREA